MNDQLTEQLAASVFERFGPIDDDGCIGAEYLNASEDIIAALDLDHWISPDRIQNKLKSLDEGEAKTQRMLAQVEKQRQVLALTLDQIQGARQVLNDLLKEGE